MNVKELVTVFLVGLVTLDGTSVQTKKLLGTVVTEIINPTHLGHWFEGVAGSRPTTSKPAKPGKSLNGGAIRNVASSNSSN